MDLTNIYAIAMTIGVIVLALSEVLKKAFNIKARYLPLVALLTGVVLGIASAPLHDAPLTHLAWGGGIAGLIASGAFDAAKQLMTKKEDDRDDNPRI